jgi:hypothetical protein
MPGILNHPQLPLFSSEFFVLTPVIHFIVGYRQIFDFRELIPFGRILCSIWRYFLTGGFHGKFDDKSSPLAISGFEAKRTCVFFGDHGMCNGQSLAGALSNRFSCKKRIKDPLLDGFRNPAAGIRDADLCRSVIAAGAYADCTLAPFPVFGLLSDGVGCVDQQI